MEEQEPSGVLGVSGEEGLQVSSVALCVPLKKSGNGLLVFA